MESKKSLADRILEFFENYPRRVATSGEIAAALGVKDGVTGRLAELYKRGKVRPVAADPRINSQGKRLPTLWELGAGLGSEDEKILKTINPPEVNEEHTPTKTEAKEALGKTVKMLKKEAKVREVKKPGQQVWWIVDEPEGVFRTATAFRSEAKARCFAKRVKGNLFETTERKRHNV